MQPQSHRTADVRAGGLAGPTINLNATWGDEVPYLANVRAVAETIEHIAIARLRQYVYDRRILHQGRLSAKQARRGPSSRNDANQYDARITRVLDFERALGTLSAEFQQILWFRYGDGQDLPTTAAGAGMSLRSVQYKLPEARKALALVLDQRDLL